MTLLWHFQSISYYLWQTQYIYAPFLICSLLLYPLVFLIFFFLHVYSFCLSVSTSLFVCIKHFLFCNSSSGTWNKLQQLITEHNLFVYGIDFHKQLASNVLTEIKREIFLEVGGHAWSFWGKLSRTEPRFLPMLCRCFSEEPIHSWMLLFVGGFPIFRMTRNYTTHS